MTIGELREILRNFEGAPNDMEIVIRDSEDASRLTPLEIWNASIIGMNDKNMIDFITSTNKKVLRLEIV